MGLGVLKRFRCLAEFLRNARMAFDGLGADALQRLSFLWRKAGLLLFSHPFRGDFRQLVRAGFANQHGDFIIGWLAAMLRSELRDRGIALRASHAVPFE